MYEEYKLKSGHTVYTFNNTKRSYGWAEIKIPTGSVFRSLDKFRPLSHFSRNGSP